MGGDTTPDQLSVDGRDVASVRGLLHDLEHGLATLVSLVEVVRGDAGLSAASAVQLHRARIELGMLFSLIGNWVDGSPVAGDEVDVRALAGDVAQLAEVEHAVRVDLLPGDEVRLAINVAPVWRVLANLVDNAARAAGPAGRVEVAVDGAADEVVVEVSDTGPGFGPAEDGLSGVRSTGLRVVTSLLDAVGGRLEVGEGFANGTRVRAVFPRRAPRCQREARG